MISLPPGCTVTYAVWIDVEELTDDMLTWYNTVGGLVTADKHYNHRGNVTEVHYVSYGKGKRCHHMKDGTRQVRLHYHGDDVSVASMFLLKFNEYVVNHNLQRAMEQREYDSSTKRPSEDLWAL